MPNISQQDVKTAAKNNLTCQSRRLVNKKCIISVNQVSANNFHNMSMKVIFTNEDSLVSIFITDRWYVLT